MATFAPSNFALDAGDDKPHHEPPPPPLPHGPFAHQLNPPPTQPYSSATPKLSPRPSRDLRHHLSSGAMAGANTHAPMAVPGGRINQPAHDHRPNLRDMGFAGPRSPPNNKNTSHVPCKFYRQGACQAGKACPFLHSDEPLTERAPCKYFTKGNCKFGQKCALAHILPNGHVVNRGNAASHFGRMNVPHHQELPINSSLLTMQAHMGGMQPGYPYALQDDYVNHKNQYDMIPTIDTTFSSHPGSNYGSPPNDNGRLPISPTHKGLSVMDVGLPASFDSQGVSTMARYGPIASSVPAKFLANSPPSSYQADSPALRNLHDSAFGDGSRRGIGALGSSPPESVEQPTGRRMLHSELAANRSRGIMSSSLGARPAFKDEEWDETDMIGKFEEDLLPNSLSDLLTPQEKMRRFSRDQGENESSFSQRAAQSRLGVSPTASDLKYGSPSAATASPSRFQSMWAKPRGPTYDNAFESGSLPGQSAFGHVGSPLRNSSLHPGASPSLRAISRPTTGDASPYLSSPPRQASMSMISQQLQRTRLSTREEASITSNPVHPGINRVTSANSIGNSSGRLGMDRAVSSSSINRERIEEEQGLFSMEEEEDVNKSRDGASTTSSTSNKRLSGLSWGSGGGKGSPNLAPVGGHRTTATSGLSKDTGVWNKNT
ncbi:hypothetical protein COCVIDRAFT_26685 [Bipolaris victoriae FI3]|uniref:C3H1-type domain-containing protein n=2 Tax=Bipolaris TaxID=33194 RepID=W6Z2T0_COCC2|nr:uncharacterized protein COCCADRAFT_32877 [Bipolaris zeicola 26-R-13]XP_014556506.1 hypothetical protein COCVIDRAFT_26685 [Bipolaris victoriae FI3]EUC37986.1 hypothetical protein COCCADRAFT_32877 [Bipolaris zeicola 26-R-13]